MRYILLSFFLLLGTLNADIMKKKTLACPSVMQLQKAPLQKADNGMKLSTYAISNECLIIDKNDKVEAVGYDPRNSKEIYQKIIHKKTGVALYIIKSSIQIEQGGKKNRYKF